MRACCILLPVIAAMLLGGCAGNGIESRKRAQPAAYAELPVAQRQLVDQGKIDVGMSTNAVFVAWGKPARVIAPIAPGTFTWIYVCQRTAQRSGWKYRDMAPAAASYYTIDRGTYLVPEAWECAEVNFENYVVKSWREIPNPGN